MDHWKPDVIRMIAELQKSSPSLAPTLPTMQPDHHKLHSQEEGNLASSYQDPLDLRLRQLRSFKPPPINTHFHLTWQLRQLNLSNALKGLCWACFSALSIILTLLVWVLFLTSRGANHDTASIQLYRVMVPNRQMYVSPFYLSSLEWNCFYVIYCQVSGGDLSVPVNSQW